MWNVYGWEKKSHKKALLLQQLILHLDISPKSAYYDDIKLISECFAKEDVLWKRKNLTRRGC